MAVPLAAGFVGSRLQGSAMNGKDNPLQKAGYNYGDTLWGTGEGWGYFSPVGVALRPQLSSHNDSSADGCSRLCRYRW